MKDYFNELEDDEKLVIFVVGTWCIPLSEYSLQKAIYLLSLRDKKYAKLFEFEESELNGFRSDKLRWILDDLIKLGILKRDFHKYFLTKRGIDYYLKIKGDEIWIR